MSKLKEKVQLILNDDTLADLLMMLKERWQHEQEYEDFADYEGLIKKNIPVAGVEFVKGIKKPFGFICKIEGKNINISIKMQEKDSFNLVAKM